MYEIGDGVPQDYKKAMELYQKAANLGREDAKESLGICSDLLSSFFSLPLFRDVES